MDRTKLYSGFFRAASSITDTFPRAGSKLLDLTILPIAGSNFLVKSKLASARRVVERVVRFQRLLVVSDLNIGDALFAQALVSGLRDFFPGAVIDIAVNRTASRFLVGNPEITNVLPAFSSAPIPSNEDLASLSRITSSGNYDLVISNSPYFELKHFPTVKKNVVEFSSFAAALINAFRNIEETGHVTYQLHRYAHLLLEDIVMNRRSKECSGVSVMLPVEAIEQARTFLMKSTIGENEKFVLVNPDTSSRFTTIPFEVLSTMLKRISKLGCRILLGSGYIDMGTERRLLETMSLEETKTVSFVPLMMALEVYSSLVDFSSVFVSGDSGPLHIAAARRYLCDGNSALKNRTELISIFGATPARIYGYDSMTPGYLPANQDAPSHAHVANSPCRNITCINKMGKTCRTTRCFEFVDVDAIVSDVEKALARELC